MDGRGYDLAECLAAIDPASLSYEEWLHAGMALHAEGYGCDVWEAWSRRDTARFREGECAKKWRGFGRSPSEVKGGTLVQMARDAGWSPDGADGRGEALGWDDDVGDDGTGGRIVDPSWVEAREVVEPAGEWRGWQDDLL